jgi:superfamily II RNA helicase
LASFQIDGFTRRFDSFFIFKFNVPFLVNGKLRVIRVLQEFEANLDSESEEFALFENRFKEMFLHGVAYMNRSMPKVFLDMTEALFQQNLIRSLVVTEEIAINSFFRTRNLVVASCRKYDGSVHR